jgi:hypothetical protein
VIDEVLKTQVNVKKIYSNSGAFKNEKGFQISNPAVRVFKILKIN